MTEAPNIAVVYTHFPHYRAPVFKALSQRREYEFSFYYDLRGINETIANGGSDRNHYDMLVRQFGKFVWQYGAIRLAISSQADGFIFLGSPYILSTWIAAVIARLRKRPTIFWTHGWIFQEKGIKAWLRRRFYRLADVLMVYGDRARQIGQAEGFDPNNIHVIHNSLDYDSQRKAREKNTSVIPTGKHLEDLRNVPPPYFLCVTRLVPVVELDVAIRALALLPCPARLVVVLSLIHI